MGQRLRGPKAPINRPSKPAWTAALVFGDALSPSRPAPQLASHLLSARRPCSINRPTDNTRENSGAPTRVTMWVELVDLSRVAFRATSSVLTTASRDTPAGRGRRASIWVALMAEWCTWGPAHDYGCGRLGLLQAECGLRASHSGLGGGSWSAVSSAFCSNPPAASAVGWERSLKNPTPASSSYIP